MTSHASTRSSTRSGAPATRRLVPLATLVAVAALVAPATAAPPHHAAGAGSVDAGAPGNANFTAWHQGFQRDVDGWVGADTDGPLGWCGQVEHVDTRGGQDASPAPSAGTGYALISAGSCNEYWSTAGIPGGSPYALGPDAALPTSDVWPTAGYVDSLDIYLDPAWSGQAAGALDFFYPDTVLQLAATVFERDYEVGDVHTGPHWVAPVDVVPDEDALSVLGHRIDEAGWYTFRFAFTAVDGEVQAAFQLRSTDGQVLVAVEDMTPQALAGPVLQDFDESLPTAEYAAGYVWFFDSPVTTGTGSFPPPPVPVAIDEHMVRPGR